MRSLLLPALLILAGLGGGIGAGLVLAPDKAAEDVDGAALPPECPAPGSASYAAAPDDAPTEFVKFSNQFMVPVLERDVVESMVVLSISVEVAEGSAERVYTREPRLRDAFLRVLFDHAQAGGFTGNFMNSVGLDTLRSALRETATGVSGPDVRDVLIVDLVKQDI